MKDHEEESNSLTSKDLIQNLSFCVFDLETTGGNHQQDKIIEIGLIKIENLKIIDEKNYLINPEIKIPDFIQNLTNISQDDVEDAFLIDDVIDEVIKFMGDSILVAHNTSFDVPFFNSVLTRLNKPIMENSSLCTNLMTKYLIPNLLNSNLNYMSKVFNISHNKAHRALDDAKATSELLITYLNIFINKGIKKINHLYYPRNRFELDRNNYKKGEITSKEISDKIEKLKTPFLITLKGENGIILFSLPCHCSPNEQEFILSSLDSFDWEIVTLKLFGPFVETLVHFNTLFNKIELGTRNKVMTFLWKEHFQEDKQFKENKKNEQSQMDLKSEEFGDFFISNHLVPEQYIIFPIKSLHPKSQLIFRFPSHKKKLIQYIISKANKISRKNLKKVFFNSQLMEFIKAILKDHQGYSKELFIFEKSSVTSNPDKLLNKFENFSKVQPKKYNFPKEYI